MQSRERVQGEFGGSALYGQSQIVCVGLADDMKQAIPLVVGPQPELRPLGNGTQLSAYGTSQTFWPLVAPPRSRVQADAGQSASLRQNWKQRGKGQPSFTQTSPGPQLSVCAAVPDATTSWQLSITALGNWNELGGLQVNAPSVFTEHFVPHAHPI